MTEDELAGFLKRAFCESGICTRLELLEARIAKIEARSVPARKPENIEEVQEEFRLKGGSMSQAEKFWTHYQMVGWVTGKAKLPIKNWRMAVSGWITRDGGSVKDGPAKPKKKMYFKTVEGYENPVAFTEIDGVKTDIPWGKE